MTEEKKIDPDAPQPYLDSDFGKELNYQIWVTKGARFTAADRLAKKHKWSTYSLAALSIYVISINLMMAYNVGIPPGVDDAALSFVSTLAAVFILLLSQLEGSKEYNVQSHRFHACSLQLARLYRRLRHVRTQKNVEDLAEKITDIGTEYADLLERYDNHDSVDYDVFRWKKRHYFLGNVQAAEHPNGFIDWLRLKLPWNKAQYSNKEKPPRWISAFGRYYLKTYLPYQAAMFGPPLLYAVFWL